MGRVSPEVIVDVITLEQVRPVGERVRPEDGVTPTGFARQGREWSIASRNPYHFGGGRFFSTPGEWLDCCVGYLFDRHDSLTLLEIFNGVYMNVSPMEALSADEIVALLCRRCRQAERRGKHICLRLDR